MGEWNNITAPTFINTYSIYTAVWELLQAPGLVGNGSITWGTANRAIYIPVTLPFPYTIQRMFWNNGTAAGGTHYVGIYGFDGAYIWRGTATGTGNSVPQYVTPSSPISLSPGTYYLGYSCNDTTANRCYGTTTTAAGKRLAGILESTVNLPTSTPTFATCTMTVYPIIGFTSTTTGY